MCLRRIFQFIDVLSVLSETRLLAIFLDDVQDADAS